jgi:hypothetical protein
MPKISMKRSTECIKVEQKKMKKSNTFQEEKQPEIQKDLNICILKAVKTQVG